MKQTTKDKNTHTIIKTIILIMLVGIVAGVGVIFTIVKTAPALDVNQILNLKETSVIYDDKGNRMDDVITTDENGQVIKRTVVSLKDTSTYLGSAFIAIEDERFRQHNGVDLRGITRAVLADVQNKFFHGNKSTQGASTITQQLIKNTIFLDDSLTNRLDYKRKIQEAYLALELEKVMSKDDILEAYMNTIFLGGNAHGVEAAAYQYFSKTSKDLTLVESAYTMYDLLKGPVSPDGTGPSAQYGDMPVAGKTGTATDLKDLWFCGLTPYYSAAVWIGNDDDKKFYNLSSDDAALIWGKLMKEANVNLPIKDITPPGGN